MQYPPWFTEFDCKRIDAALDHAGPPPSSPSRWIEGTKRLFYKSNADAVKAVIPVCRTIARVLLDRPDQRPSGINVPATARGLLDDVTATIYDWCLPDTTMTIDVFEQRVQERLRKHPWWTDVLRVRSMSSERQTPTPNSPTRDDLPKLLSVERFVQELETAGRSISRSTAYRWINEGKIRVNRKTGRSMIPRRQLERILDDDQFLSDRDR